MAGSELDGLDGADGSMFSGAVWVLTPVAGHRRHHVRRGRGRRRPARRRGRGDGAGPPRRDGRRRQPRAPPHRGQPDGPRRRPGRRARRPAAPRRRRLPRHDPRGQRASRHLARRVRREPPGDPVGPRRTASAGSARCARSSAPTPATSCYGRLQRARDARTNLPIHATHPRSWPRCASRSRTAPARPPRSSRWPPSSASTSPASRSSTSPRATSASPSCLVAADVADLYRGGLIARGFRPAVTRLS